MNNKHILVSSVSPWSDSIGSDTMTSLLSQFLPEQVSSINIRAQRSDSMVADRYFHILERRVVKSILHPSLVTGEAYAAGDANGNSSEQEAEKKLYGKHRKCSQQQLYVIARELVWKLGHWKSKELDDFVSDFQPDVFFFPIESYIHFNRLNRYIIERFKPARVICYMWDDNFTYKQHTLNLLYTLHRCWLRKSVKWLIRHCDAVFAITPKLKRELDAEYGIDSVLLTKPIRTAEAFRPYIPASPIRMLYTGKLIIGRDKTIATVVDAIRKVNADGQKVALDIYTGTTLPDELRERIAVESCCKLHDFIPQQQVFEKQKKADVLLFAESLSNRDLAARLSFSTKITDYFSAGKCIWAIGNRELASIDYLRSEDAAIVSTSEAEVEAALRKITEDKTVIPAYARKAYECGMTKHNKEEMLTKFRNIAIGGGKTQTNSVFRYAAPALVA